MNSFPIYLKHQRSYMIIKTLIGRTFALTKAPWDNVFLENNIEQIKRHLKKKRNVPCLTSAIRRLFLKRKRLWKKAKSSQLQSDWDKYKQCSNKVKSELNKSYWHHIQSLKNSDNPKRFWSFRKSKTKSRSIPPEVSFENQKGTNGFNKAQLFNKFFTSVFIDHSPGVPDQL
ncbi:hypothetical protein P5673_029063 [Acropora cervicornis]|uniref:Uncharacterized protein n=1 Tax=Acropora cervicornis TaxID=6130 RepID=A0AAD9PWI6_ACRCE|nr:hypothetical protein P5673_029063 [Acropora cervicornis]